MLGVVMDRQNKRLRDGQQRNRARRQLSLPPALRDRRRLSPYVTRMGPVALTMCSVLLISFMAILYLAQLGQAVRTNQQIQDLHSQQTELQRQNQDLINIVAQ